MNTKTVNISLPPKLINELDRVAKQRDANRSELIRDALRTYLDRRRDWESVFAYGRAHAKRLNITEEDVLRAVREIRGKK